MCVVDISVSACVCVLVCSCISLLKCVCMLVCLYVCVIVFVCVCVVVNGGCSRPWCGADGGLCVMEMMLTSSGRGLTPPCLQ